MHKVILKEELEEVYHIQKMTISEIAKHFEVSYNTIKHWLRKYKMQSRKSTHYLDDLTNQTFDFLTVIKDSGERTKNGTKIWLCQCKCGNQKKYPTNKLNSNEVKTCGCRRKCRSQEFKYYGDINYGFWNGIKNSAIRRGLDFNITVEEAWNLFLKQDRKCSMTGIELKMPSIIYKERVNTDNCASLDRIDSTKGYTIDNIHWVHKWVNLMKLDFSKEEFIYICKKVSDYNQ